jgi:hypothetical protein
LYAKELEQCADVINRNNNEIERHAIRVCQYEQRVGELAEELSKVLRCSAEAPSLDKQARSDKTGDP